jgi:hypothetical protein
MEVAAVSRLLLVLLPLLPLPRPLPILLQTMLMPELAPRPMGVTRRKAMPMAIDLPKVQSNSFAAS